MKYRNQHCELNGEKYRSKRERDRHTDLIMLGAAGKIAGLTREVPFVLAPGVVIQGRKRPPLRYVADFVYTDVESQNVIVEDAKGVRTEGYRIKRHLMKAIHGVEILET